MSKQVIIRLVVILVAFLNQALVTLGFTALPWSGDEVGLWISTAFTIVVAAWGWWKNNNVTTAAVTSQKVLDLIKDGTVTIQEAERLIAEALLHDSGK
ncbi:MAG: phage holin [Peptococcaceae bacterium]|jgi:SPP1 family holin|nr:phage holin [Peptococcaceae bacterium]